MSFLAAGCCSHHRAKKPISCVLQEHGVSALRGGLGEGVMVIIRVEDESVEW